jgi:hypothetical protein
VRDGAEVLAEKSAFGMMEFAKCKRAAVTGDSKWKASTGEAVG